MNLLTSPVNFSSSFSDLLIILSLSVKLSGNKDLFSLSIKRAIRESVPPRLIIETVKDAIKDNRVAIEMLLGKKVTDKILSYDRQK